MKIVKLILFSLFALMFVNAGLEKFSRDKRTL